MSRLVSSGVALCSASGLAFAMVSAGLVEPAIVQPLPFDHALHASFDLECVDCHEGVEEYAIARIPRLSLCMECHEEDAESEEALSPAKEKLLSYAESGSEIPWVRLYRLSAHVVFSHERHVTFGEVACSQCHGDHGSSDRPPPRPVTAPLTMDGCMACHESAGASNDCIACHR
jgi:hypothetical protein